MMLYRYELLVDGEPQQVGILRGLGDLYLSAAEEENLLKPFNEELEIPDLSEMSDSVSFFTEHGNAKFQADILRIVAAYEDSVFEVVRYSLDLQEHDFDAIIYQDENQVCIPWDWYYGTLFPKITQEIISIPESLGESFRIRNPVLIGDLYHVGTMDISKKRKQSHEWNGLSVSNCPDAWIIITDGFTFGDYFLLKKDDLKLLDYYALEKYEKEEIKHWALENGYVQEAKLYKSIFWGEEGEEYYSLFDSYDRALSEADDEPERVKDTEGLIPAQKLLSQSLVKVELLQVPSIITALYTEQVLDYDGIWWEEILDPYGYSAPRGAIFNSKVALFDITNTTKRGDKKHESN